MRKLFGLIFCMLSVSVVTSQESHKFELATKDSLEKLLAFSLPDTNRVMILSELSIRYLRSSHDTATMYAQKGLALARTLRFRQGEADCLRRSGLVLFQQGRYPEALDIYQRALKISERINYSFGIRAGLGHIGNIYNTQGDYPQARSYYFRSLKMDTALLNASEQATALANIGRSYLQQGLLDSASEFFNRVLKVIGENWDLRLADVWTDMGKLQAKLGNVTEARFFFRRSISFASSVNNFITLSEAYVAIADLFRTSGQSDSCIFYARLGLSAGQQNKYAKGILAASEILSQVYESIDEHQAFKYHKMATAIKDSLFNAEKANEVQNLFFVEQQRQQAAETANLKYRNQLKLFVLLIALTVFLLVAIILWRNNSHRKRAYLLLQNQKLETEQQKQKAELALEDLKSTQSQLIQSEKMASLGELTAGIAHEIQNPLNFVNNFSDVNKELLLEMKEELSRGNMEEGKAMVNDIIANEEKINHHGKRAEGIVKGMLLHSQKSVGIKEPTDINALADEYLRMSYYSFQSKHKDSPEIKLVTNFEDNMPLVNVIPQDIGRVLLNLFNNAFWACAERGRLEVPSNSGGDWKSENASSDLRSPFSDLPFSPQVTLTTKNLGDQSDSYLSADRQDRIEIRIADNGPGIPPHIIDKIFQPFFTTKPSGQGTGLGLSLAYDIIKAHEGSIHVVSNHQEPGIIGAEFIIRLPLNIHG